MYQDEVILEVWKNKESYACRHNHDLHQIVADLKRRQDKTDAKLVDRRVQRRKFQDIS